MNSSPTSPQEPFTATSPLIPQVNDYIGAAIVLISIILLTVALMVFFRCYPKDSRRLWIPLVLIVIPLLGPSVYLYMEFRWSQKNGSKKEGVHYSQEP